MTIYYAGKDISEMIDVKCAVHDDFSEWKRDTLDISFNKTEKWFGWQPQKDDTIRLIHGNYDTGIMYVNTLCPSDGEYRIIATATKCAARRKAFKSYENKTLGQIMSLCAAECGMDWALFGVEKNYAYDYIIRDNEGCTAFLSRLMAYEGAVLKTLNGKLRGISIEYAQNIEAKQTIKIDTGHFDADYVLRNDLKIKKVTVQSAFATAYAMDTAVENGLEITINMPVTDSTTAGRWARGWLLCHNRMAEELTISMELNTGLTALGRIDVDSTQNIAGKWIIDDVEHDFVNLKSRVKLLRCIETVR